MDMMMRIRESHHEFEGLRTSSQWIPNGSSVSVVVLCKGTVEELVAPNESCKIDHTHESVDRFDEHGGRAHPHRNHRTTTTTTTPVYHLDADATGAVFLDRT